MTIDELNSLNLPFDNPTNETCLYIEAGLDWLKENTTLEFDSTKIDTIKALPSGAKLFLLKFNDIMTVDTTIASESLGGMSQSFSTSSKTDLLMDLASELLGTYLKSSFTFIPAVRKWS